ncbi:MAG: A24 family peptidase [Pelistega sp.]|nr:A24 family peptidase [Pelistega sp.]
MINGSLGLVLASLSISFLCCSFVYGMSGQFSLALIGLLLISLSLIALPLMGLILMGLSLALTLNQVYRRHILGLYRVYRHEAYIRTQKSYRRQLPPYALGLGFVCLSLWAVGQFFSQDIDHPLLSFHHSLFQFIEVRSFMLLNGGITQSAAALFSELRSLLLLSSLLLSLAVGLLIASIDYKVHLIPTHLVLLLALCLVLASILSVEERPLWNLQRALFVYVLLRLGLYLLARLSGKEGMGQGDINLMAALALWFDVYSCLFLIMIASLLGLVYIFMHNICAKHKEPLRVIAFGPWIICASLILLQINVLES